MLRIYDEFLEDETINALKDRTYRVHVSALIYCARNLTDGYVSDKAVKVLQIVLGFPLKKHVAELVELEVWVPVDGGYEIRNYLEFNPKASTVKKERAQARERMRTLRDKRAGSEERSPEQGTEHSPEGDGAVPNQSGPVLAFEGQEIAYPRAVPGLDQTASEQPLDQQVGHTIDQSLRGAA